MFVNVRWRLTFSHVFPTLKIKSINFTVEIKDINQLHNIFFNEKVRTLFIKILAPKQDNEKNQIFLGSDVGLFNTFPCKLKQGLISQSQKKNKSNVGKPKLEAHLDFYWLNNKGEKFKAPNSKFIFYFQYPEIRFSGFLSKCKCSPESLRRDKQKVFGKRILIMGINSRDEILGIVLNELENETLLYKLDLSNKRKVHSIFYEYFIPSKVTSEKYEIPKLFEIDEYKKQHLNEFDKSKTKNKESNNAPTNFLYSDQNINLLLSELKDISNRWFPSMILKSNNTSPIPFKGLQGGGLTLEAVLGIECNSRKGDDKYGIELKVLGKKISLMTPVADMGIESESFKDFMQDYGYKDQNNENKILFNGSHKYSDINKKTKLTLELKGYDLNKKKFKGVEKESEILAGLFDENAKKLVSGWSFQKLLECWMIKHSKICYVEYKKRPYQGNVYGHDFEYFFTGKVFIGTGTSLENFFNGIANKKIIFDPGHSWVGGKTPHKRHQWRTINAKIETLSYLYNDIREINLA